MHTTFSQHGIEKKTHASMRTKARAYAKKLARAVESKGYTTPESSLALAGDTRYQNAITKAVTPFKKVSHVVLIGIGGSSLGTEAVYAALAPHNAPTLTVLDTIDDEAQAMLVADLKKVRSVKDIAIVIITKSGTTSETLVNASKGLKTLEKRFGSAVMRRVLCVGDAGTPFHAYAKAGKLTFVEIPATVGGRYSIFSGAGMVPLALLGIDTIALRTGARAALTANGLDATAGGAATLATYATTGTRIVNFFTFNDRLEKLGYWYRQLLAESIGKATTTKDTPFANALLPIVSTAADLHSMAQLYLSGYEHTYTRFVFAPFDRSPRIDTHPIIESVPFLAKRTMNDVRSAIKDGVVRAYDEKRLPYQYTEIPKIDAYEIGYLLASLMSETMILAGLLEVNAFDQPNVELYKKHTRTALT
jgi:glucose-6-phosphate isomerase